MLYDKDTIYILGTAKISKNDPIAAIFDIFFLGLVIKRSNGEIVDVTCNMVKDATTDFIRSMLIGYNLIKDMDEITIEVKNRFHGMAQKAVIAAVKDAKNKYLMISK